MKLVAILVALASWVACACARPPSPATAAADPFAHYLSGHYDWEVPTLGLRGYLRIHDPPDRMTRDTMVVATTGTVSECRGGLYGLTHTGTWSCGFRLPPDRDLRGTLSIHVHTGGIRAVYEGCQYVGGQRSCGTYEALIVLRAP